MSGEALYERYKDALRRGHVASLQGRLAEALAAYAEAASIAPERATPHTSAGNALLRRARPQEALDQFLSALRLAPRDEAALLGRAEALVALDRAHEAADAFDTVAEIRATAGRLADAVDAARRGLELAEGRERRRILRALVGRLRAAEPEAPGRAALERALRVLDGPAVRAASSRGGSTAAEPAAAEPTEPETAAEAGADGLAAVGSEAPEIEAAETVGAEPVAAEPRAAEPEPEQPGPRRVLDRELPDGSDAASLALLAEAAIDAGDAGEAVERLLDLAAARQREECREAALDACYLGLSMVPDHVTLHLALAELYDERGWRATATEKLDLLDRMATLDGDMEAIEAVTAARAARS